MECEAYFIFDYNEELLSLPYLDCYDFEGNGERKYVRKEERDQDSVYNSVKKQ